MSDQAQNPDAASRGDIPERLGKYRILRRVGRGSMGVVYAALNEENGNEVALKVLMADLESDPGSRARFVREGEAAASLRHENIIAVHEFGEAQARLFIAMELLAGCTLAEFLKRAEAEFIERKIDLMMQICEGLAVAHSSGVCHRDIKPSNLFVENGGHLRILDFGVARVATSHMTASGVLVGTPDYMSPEQARGQAVDNRSDLFSAGGVFYWMVTGRKPFAARDLAAILRKVEREDPLPIRPEEAPAGLAQIIMRALVKEPAARYQRAAEILGDLVRFKRKFDEETRALAVATASLLGETEASLVRRRTMSMALGVTPPDRAALTAIRAQIAGDGARADEAILTVPWMRTRLLEINQGVADEHRSQGGLAEQESAALALLHAAVRAHADDQLEEAMRSAERVLQTVPGCAQARTIFDDCRTQVDQQRTRTEKALGLVAQATNAVAAMQWNEAIATCEEALALIPGLSAALETRTRAQVGLDRMQREQAQAVTNLLTAADRAIARGQFDDAEQMISEALGSGADSRADDLRARLHHARMAVAEATARGQRITGAIARARRDFQAGRGQEAMSALAICLSQEGQPTEVAAELKQMRADLERQEREERTRAEIAEALAAAQAALIGGTFHEAVAQAQRVLTLDPGHAAATALVATARAREREASEAEAKRAAVARHATVARDALSRNQIAKAIKAAEAAIAADPLSAPAAALMADVLERDLEERIARERAATSMTRAKAAAKTLAVARSALEAGDATQAVMAAQTALLIAPDWAAARQVLGEASASGVPSSDVDLDDTVDGIPPPMTPVPSPINHKSGLNRLSGWATDIVRRLHSAKGEMTVECALVASILIVVVTLLIRPSARGGVGVPQAIARFVSGIADGIHTVAP